jgi:hypothetical protein
MLFRGFLLYPFLYILFEIARYQQWTIDGACRMKEGLQLLTIRSAERSRITEVGCLRPEPALGQRARTKWNEFPQECFPLSPPLLITTDSTLILCDKIEGVPSRLLQWVSFGSKFRISELASFWLRNEHRGD